MKRILLGFIAIGLLTFVGCEKDDDTDTTDGTETSSNDGSTDTSDEGTDTSSDEVKDADGYTYKTVTIGTQEWMAENLRTTKYSDGTAIPNVTDNDEWGDLSTGAWCHYDNDNQYDTIYGKLYNWYAVETDKLCPTGWHVPTDAEWTALTDYLTANGHKEGTVLKATSGWGSGGNGTDDYEWLGLPGGGRGYDSGFYGGGIGIWWSSSQDDMDDSWLRGLANGDDSVYRNFSNKKYGFSVRCLRD